MNQRIGIATCFLLGAVCCATIIVWARSYVSSEALLAARPLERVSAVATEGRLILAHGRLRFASPEVWQNWRNAINPGIDIYNWTLSVHTDLAPVPGVENSVAGFGLSRMESDTRRGRQIPGVTWRRTTIEVPFWAIAAVSGTWPAWRLWKSSRQRGHRIAGGLCRRCGFDLAGVYYSCPKCGQRLPLPAFEFAKAK